MADLVEKGLTEENVKVRTLGLAPLQTVPAAVCLASPGVMLRGCPGVGGVPTPLAANSLQPLEAPLSCERTMPGGCEEDSASGPYLQLCLLVQHAHPVFQPPRARAPGWSQRKIPSQASLGAWQPQSLPRTGH